MEQRVDMVPVTSLAVCGGGGECPRIASARGKAPRLKRRADVCFPKWRRSGLHVKRPMKRISECFAGFFGRKVPPMEAGFSYVS